MKLSRFINILAVASMVLAALGVSYTPVVAQGETPDFGRDVLYVPGELIVRYNKTMTRSTALAAANSTAKKLGGGVVENQGNSNLLSFKEDADITALAKTIATQPGVKDVQPNYIYWIPEEDPLGSAPTSDTVKLATSDGFREVSKETLAKMKSLRRVDGVIKSVPSYPQEAYDQWGFWATSTGIVWPEKTPSAGVCVIDTGVDVKHPDLIAPGPTPRAFNGYDFVNDDAIANDDNGHGTHVSGTITAVMNNKKGFSGIANGKVVAVKVLTAQGWGTSWNIAEGIEYCANRADVKVLNMSLGGGGPDGLEFDALDYAINTKGKLVVTAAGNDSTSALHYPSSWAAPFVCANGTSTFPANCPSNVIYQGIISVGAGASWYYDNDPNDVDENDDGYLWVDLDGDGIQVVDDTDPTFMDEHFYLEDCAAWFSNYGAWVNILAPGEDILSTIPVSYPFHDETYYGADGDNDGYEWFNGTSMATPHVAAAAARVWSVFPALNNADVKSQLINTGATWMEFAMDPNINDPSIGYYDDGYLGEAPYCWPDGSYGPEYDTSAATYLDVAAAMNRGAIWGNLSDATTGLPLKGGVAKAFIGTTLKDQSTIAYDNQNWFDLLNLPAGQIVTVKVNKAGYTYGDQIVATLPVFAGIYLGSNDTEVSVPPNNGRIHAVVNWDSYNEDMDFFAWTPASQGFIIGPWDPGTGIYLDAGDFNDIPFARWNRDGGFSDPMPMESISISPRPGVPNNPYYNVTASDQYDFFLTDFGTGLFNASSVTVRVWRGGKIIGTSHSSDLCDYDGVDDIEGNDDDEEWWHAGFIKGSAFTASDDCGVGNTTSGDPSGVWPYKLDRDGTMGIPERPVKNK